jgi:hypothetical protein
VWNSVAETKFPHESAAVISPELRPQVRQLMSDNITILEELLVTARRRRNSFAPVSILPDEILTDVFLTLRDCWKPHDADESRRLRRERFPYALNWIWVTHVCHSWRKVDPLSINDCRVLLIVA